MNDFAAASCFALMAAVMAFHPSRASGADTKGPMPQTVSLGGIIHPDSDGSLAFTPDGDTAFFDRSKGDHKTIMVTHRTNDRWSPPQVVSFSGHWYDQDPAVAPDGAYVIFSSDRPTPPGSQQQFRIVDGKPYRISNLWKAARRNNGWGEAVWLGPVVNDGQFLVSPSIAADGTLYFIRHGEDHAMHVFSSRHVNGEYLAPVRTLLGDPAITTHDPAIAPDGSFIVFGYGKTTTGLGRLCIAFRAGAQWSKPIDLGDVVNRDGPSGSHVASDGRTLYFTGDTGIHRLSLDPWLRGHRTRS